MLPQDVVASGSKARRRQDPDVRPKCWVIPDRHLACRSDKRVVEAFLELSHALKDRRSGKPVAASLQLVLCIAEESGRPRDVLVWPDLLPLLDDRIIGPL
jgi:hypothetical protein